jgi:hypothetical protein
MTGRPLPLIALVFTYFLAGFLLGFLDLAGFLALSDFFAEAFGASPLAPSAATAVIDAVANTAATSIVNSFRIIVPLRNIIVEIRNPAALPRFDRARIQCAQPG